MASTIISMTMMNTKSFNTTTSPKFHNPTKLITKPTSLLSLKNLLPKETPTTTTENTNLSSSIAGTALAGAIFSTLGACNPAFAAQQIADIAEASSDNRGLALLLPIIPAIAWVLFNILQPALNQINRMRNKGVIIGLGLGGFTASGFVETQDAMASEIAAIAEAGSDNRGQLLLFVVAPAILWVLYNILQPALNQINKMRSD